MGKELELKLFASVNGKKEYRGILKSFSKESFALEVGSGEKIEFARKNVALFWMIY